MRHLRVQDVVDLWDHLSSVFDTRVVPKSASPLMHACGGALGLLRIQSRATFMSRYTTVIHRRIYPPFLLDSPGSEATLWGRAATGIHEHQHVVQADRDGFLRFATRYLTSQRARAEYEAEAYGTELELMRWAGRSARAPEELAAELEHYGCGEVARGHALVELRAIDAATGVETEATKVAIEWLGARLSEADAG